MDNFYLTFGIRNPPYHRSPLNEGQWIQIFGKTKMETSVIQRSIAQLFVLHGITISYSRVGKIPVLYAYTESGFFYAYAESG
uniref:Uncharacterized protein n=1 Tax=Onchocerca volvulus TaxID=6282 RepID=A0A8R1TVF6_ONCVO